MNHQALPDDYYTNELWQDSPLTDAERETFRDEIRQLVLGIKEDVDFEIEHPAIGALSLVSFRDEPLFQATVFLHPDELERDPVGDETFDAEGEVTVSDDAHFLRDLGHEWEALEYDILSELVLMLDLPEIPDELSKYLLGGENHGPCLYCTSRMPSQASFSVSASIPEHTQEIYDNAEFELARRLGIPIDGASK